MTRSILTLLVLGTFPIGAGATAIESGVRAERHRSEEGYPGAESDKQYAPDRQFDLIHTALDLELDLEAGTIAGEAAITLAPFDRGLTELVLHASELNVSAVRIGAPADRPYDPPAAVGAPVQFSHRDGDLRIRLPRPAQMGEPLTVVVSYSGAPRRGLYFVQPTPYAPDRPLQAWSQGEDEDNRYWFPGWDFPNDRGTSSLTATVDERFTVVGNGERLSVDEVDGGRRRWSFYQAQPHVTYLVSIVVGEFDELVQDWDGIPVEYYVPLGLGDRIALNMANDTPAMMDFMSEYIGVRYPYAKYAQTSVYEYIFGGMENISATTLTVDALRDDIAGKESDMFGLVSHELAHQWWGDMISSREWSHVWLNEGFATYFESLALEALRGEAERDWDMRGNLDSYLGEGYERSTVERRFRIPMDLFDSHAYARGACVLHLLRWELGDGPFQRGIQSYAQKYAWKTVTTADLIDALEQASGRSLHRFFDQWVRSPGHAHFKVGWSWDSVANSIRVTIDQEEPAYEVDLQLTVLAEDGSRAHHRVQVSRPHEEVYLPANAAPLSVLPDPDGWLLAEFEETAGPEELADRLGILREGEGIHLRARVRTIRALAEAGALPEGIEALHGALGSDPFWGVRTEAAEALGKVGSEAAREALVGALADPDPRVRAAAAKALGEFRNDGAAADALLKLWKTDDGYGPRAEAVLGLARIRAPRAATVCRSALGVDSFRDEIRRRALDGLVELDRSGEAADAARELVRIGAPGRIRSHSLTILGNHAETLHPVDDRKERRDLARELEEHLLDRNFYVRSNAVKALVKLAETSTIPALRRVAAASPERRLEVDAEDAIGKIRERSEILNGRGDMAKRLGDLEEERDRLKERLDSLERRLEAMADGEASPPAEE